MLNYYPLLVKRIACITLLIFFQNSIQSQELFQQKNLDTVFNNYAKPFQEVIYAHLNKSKFIKGESLGFTSYAFNKQNKLLSSITSNLYCIITDSNNKVVKEKLIQVKNGIANGSFKIDSIFKSGKYTFKSYTNWMLNFSKHNYFVDTFEVIDPETIKFAKRTKRSHKIDIQILPESGHLLSDVINTMGVVVKDSLGYGFANLKGEIFDTNNNHITSFQLNKLGIGRFSFIPKSNVEYKAIINKNGEKITTNFTEKTKVKGILLRVSTNSDHTLISAVTNKNTLPELKNKIYKLVFHDGERLNTLDIKFNEKTNITKEISFKKLSKGINIFTLFDEKNRPLAERMFFNYEKLNIIKTNSLVNKTINDSIINASYKFKNARNIGFNNVSISVLPKQTKSYVKNTSIISQLLIKPYIKGFIENGGYYFTDINDKKKYELDNLLITQGWSSYNWNEIFNYNSNFTHRFQKGIVIQANNPNPKDEDSYVIHNLSNRSSEFIKFNNEVNSFTSKDYFPLNNENLYISKKGKKDGLTPASLYLQFKPNNIPNIISDINYLSPKKDYNSQEYLVDASNFYTFNKRTELDEIQINVNLEKKRIEEIKNKSRGKVYFIEKNIRNLTVAQFINIKSNTFKVSNNNGATNIINTEVVATGLNAVNRPPSVILDGVEVIDFDFLSYLRLDVVDYIEINEFNTGTRKGLTRRGQGLIEIVTNPSKYYNNEANKSVQKFKFPVTFTEAKKFYIPKYNNYNNSFFKDYGVIDWLPKNEIDRNGFLNLRIKNVQSNDITLFMEGVTEDGDYIFEEKTIKVTPNKNI